MILQHYDPSLCNPPTPEYAQAQVGGLSYRHAGPPGQLAGLDGVSWPSARSASRVASSVLFVSPTSEDDTDDDRPTYASKLQDDARSTSTRSTRFPVDTSDLHIVDANTRPKRRRLASALRVLLGR